MKTVSCKDCVIEITMLNENDQPIKKKFLGVCKKCLKKWFRNNPDKEAQDIKANGFNL